MWKTYLFVFILFLITGGALLGVFLINGFPVSQQSVAFDKARLSDFTNISYRIQEYYTSNKVLPMSLDKVSESQRYASTPFRLTDPQTKKAYGYHVKGAYEYELCTTFAADYKAQQQSNGSSYGYYLSTDFTVKLNYKKGPACVSYALPTYLHEVTPTPTMAQLKTVTYNYPTPTPINKIRAPMSGTIVCSEYSFNIDWFSKGKGMHTASIALVSPENIGRMIGTVNIPHENDSEMLDQYTWDVPSSVSSLKLPKEYGYYITVADTLDGKTTATTGEKFEIRNCEG
jgi:hypothetical protein